MYLLYCKFSYSLQVLDDDSECLRQFETHNEQKDSTKKSLLERQNILYPIFRTKQCEADECNSIIYDLWAHDETW